MRTLARTPLKAKPGQFISVAEAAEYAPSILADRPHDKMSSRYSHLSTLETINAFIAEGFGITSVQAVRPREAAREGYEKHLLRFSKLDAPQWDDRVEIINVNAHDGSAADMIMLGVFRMACANGIIAGTQFESERIRHVGDAATQLREAISKVSGRFNEISGVVDHWKTITLNHDEYYEFAEQAQNLILPSEEGATRQMSGAPTQLLRTQRASDMGRDLWTVFNVAQERIMQGKYRVISENVRGQIRHGSGRAITSISRTVEINRALWDIAAKFAA
jgi:hypothetical protein